MDNFDSDSIQNYWKYWSNRASFDQGAVLKIRRWRSYYVSTSAADALSQLSLDGEMSRYWAAWFWFNHFNVHANKSQIAPVLSSYTEHAIGHHLNNRFADLLKAVTVHPAMLMYLDNVRNVRGKGNENQARELLELHTLGVGGGYTQADVTEAARAMTGWGVRLRGDPSEMGQTVFSPQQHEPGSKTVLGRVFADAGSEELPALLDHLAQQPATARHLARKLAVWWLADEPPPDAVDRLVAVYMQTGGSLPALWAEGLKLQQQAGQQQGGGQRLWKFKDPLRYVTSAVRLVTQGAPLDDPRPLERWVRLLGMPMFLRGSPDGYPLAGREWMNAGQLAQRVELARDMVAVLPRLVTGDAVRGTLARSPFESAAVAQWAGRLSLQTRAEVEKAHNTREAWALLLSCPEFMYV